MKNKQPHRSNRRPQIENDSAYNKYPDSQDRSGALQSSFAKKSIDSHLPWSKNMAGAEGPHAGKGPKTYRRSDEKIYEEINEALTHHPGIDASEIEVSVKNAAVTLSGTIESRHMKEIAEECVAEILGVKDIKNDLRIDTTYASRLRTSETGAQQSSSRSISDKL